MKKIYHLLVKKPIKPGAVASDVEPFVPHNYILFLLNNFLTQLADALSSTKTVMVWLMNALGVPLYITALLVPVRESGSMLPQAFMANMMRQKTYRKPIWITGAIFQALSLVIIGCLSLWSSVSFIGWILLIMVAVFSFGRSLCSLSSKDIIGRTIPKNQRGSLTGYAQGISGGLVLIIGVLFQIVDVSDTLLPWLIIAAGIVWTLATIIYTFVVEPIASNTEKSHISVWKILYSDSVLQRFIAARALLLCSALTTPFYVTLLQTSQQNALEVLGLIIIVTGVAGVISSPIWGHMADRSSRKVMSYAGFISALLALIVVVILWLEVYIPSVIFYLIVILLVSVAHNGVRVGRKTYIVNITEGNKRIEYVSISNTVIAVILLCVGLLTSLLSLISITSALFVLGVMGIIGSYLSHHLPDAGESLS